MVSQDVYACFYIFVFQLDKKQLLIRKLFKDLGSKKKKKKDLGSKKKNKKDLGSSGMESFCCCWIQLI